MKFETKSMIATVIILFIAGSAFLAGFLHESYASSAADTRRDAENLQVILTRMENRVLYLMKRDEDLRIRADDYFIQALNLDVEYVNLNNTLTDLERDIYLTQINFAFQQQIASWSGMKVVGWYRYFNVSQGDYWMATKEDDGYDLIITWEMWSDYVSTYGLPVEVLTPAEYYGNWGCYDDIQSLPFEQRPIDFDSGKEIFIVPDGDLYSIHNYFLLEQVRGIQEEIDQMLRIFVKLETQASSIGSGVAMTTIAVVLSTAMANRINQRKLELEFEKIREKEERLAKKKRDLISVPVLIIASILCLLGVILPIFLNLLG